MKKRLLYTILSISLLTVMAGAAIAPALGVISAHFEGRNPLLIQLIVSLPALFIILTNLLFPRLCRMMKTRTLALTGLALYVLSGAGAFFVDNIWLLLVFRALMGVSVGMIMPLSTGLLAYYFPPEEQAGLMGLSAAMNQMGGVVATFLAGMLAGISWNYAFQVYLLGLIAVILVALFLPNERLSGRGGVSLSLLRRFHPSVVGMFLVMVLFFIYPTNFALTASGTLSEMGVTLTMGHWRKSCLAPAWIGLHRHCKWHWSAVPEYHRQCKSGQGGCHDRDAITICSSLSGAIPFTAYCVTSRFRHRNVTLFRGRRNRGPVSVAGDSYA